MAKKNKKKKAKYSDGLELFMLASLAFVGLLGVALYTKKKQKIANLENAVLDAAGITGKRVGVDENGELIIYDKKQ